MDYNETLREPILDGRAPTTIKARYLEAHATALLAGHLYLASLLETYISEL